MTSYTIDFSAYSIEEGGVEGVFEQHNLSTIFQGDYKFEDVSLVDTGGLTAWDDQIEVQSQDESNWTIVRLSHVDGNYFSLDDFDYWGEGAHTYKLVSDAGVEYEVNSISHEWGMDDLVDTTILDNSFSNLSYVDFYSRAIPDDDTGRINTKWHLDDIEVNNGETFVDRATLDTAVDAWIANETTATATYGDINNWDVSDIDDFSNLFSVLRNPGAYNFNSDISNWDVSSGTNFSRMFYNANDFNQEISSWDVGKGTTFYQMFRSASSFNQDIGNWDVSAGTNFNYMFTDANVFNQDIGSWNVSSGNNFGGMFYMASSFNQDIGNWDVSAGTSFSWMFFDANVFNQDISSWDVSAGHSFSYMFSDANVFNQDIGSWDVSNATTFSGMFSGASTFDQNLSLWDVSSANSLADMFLDTAMIDSQGISSTPNTSYFQATTGNDIIKGTAGIVDDSLRGHNGNDRLKGFGGNDTIFGDGGQDKLYGGHGSDVLYGGASHDKLVGGGGSDTLIGGGGNDKLFGEDKDDILSGGAGNDKLVGGNGLDTLTGGNGKDIFYLSANTGRDKITDYQSRDKLKLTGALTENDLTIRQVGDNVKIKYEGDLLAIVQDTLITDLTFI